MKTFAVNVDDVSNVQLITDSCRAIQTPTAKRIVFDLDTDLNGQYLEPVKALSVDSPFMMGEPVDSFEMHTYDTISGYVQRFDACINLFSPWIKRWECNEANGDWNDPDHPNGRLFTMQKVSAALSRVKQRGLERALTLFWSPPGYDQPGYDWRAWVHDARMAGLEIDAEHVGFSVYPMNWPTVKLLSINWDLEFKTLGQLFPNAQTLSIMEAGLEPIKVRYQKKAQVQALVDSFYRHISTAITEPRFDTEVFLWDFVAYMGSPLRQTVINAMNAALH